MCQTRKTLVTIDVINVEMKIKNVKNVYYIYACNVVVLLFSMDLVSGGAIEYHVRAYWVHSFLPCTTMSA